MQTLVGCEAGFMHVLGKTLTTCLHKRFIRFTTAAFKACSVTGDYNEAADVKLSDVG